MFRVVLDVSFISTRFNEIQGSNNRIEYFSLSAELVPSLVHTAASERASERASDA